MHVDHRAAQATLLGAITQFAGTVEALSDYGMLAASRCHGWAVLDVVTHVRVGLQEMLEAFTAVTNDSPDQDAGSYWGEFAGNSDPVEPTLWTRRTSSAYRRPRGAVQHLRMAADAVGGAADQMQEGRVKVPGRHPQRGRADSRLGDHGAQHHRSAP